MAIDINIDGIYTMGKIGRGGYIDTQRTFGGTMKIFEKGNEMVIVKSVGKNKFKIFYKCNIVG